MKGFPPLRNDPEGIGTVWVHPKEGRPKCVNVAKDGGNGRAIANTGRFGVNGLASGTYRLRLVTDSDRTELERTVTVAPGETVEVELAK